MKIESIYTEESVWRHVPGKGLPGAQIDLLLNRRDRCINICEIKFSTERFAITKKYADELTQKQKVFADKTKTRKTIFLTMITTFGVAKNAYYKSHVQGEVKMDVIFVLCDFIYQDYKPTRCWKKIELRIRRIKGNG